MCVREVWVCVREGEVCDVCEGGHVMCVREEDV